MTTGKEGGPGKGRRAPRAAGKPDKTPRMAEGSVVRPLELRLYRVVIEYREPTYATHSGATPKTYRGTYVVKAHDPVGAEALARREFEEMARLSSVGWVRDIVRIITVEA